MPPAMWIEIDEGEDPISGVLHEEGRVDVRFRGWLQFATVLEEARAQAQAKGESTGEGEPR